MLLFCVSIGDCTALLLVTQRQKITNQASSPPMFMFVTYKTQWWQVRAVIAVINPLMSRKYWIMCLVPKASRVGTVWGKSGMYLRPSSERILAYLFFYLVLPSHLCLCCEVRWPEHTARSRIMRTLLMRGPRWIHISSLCFFCNWIQTPVTNDRASKIVGGLLFFQTTLKSPCWT